MGGGKGRQEVIVPPLGGRGGGRCQSDHQHYRTRDLHCASPCMIVHTYIIMGYDAITIYSSTVVSSNS